MKIRKFFKFVFLLLIILGSEINLIAQDKKPENLTLERIFASREFASESFGLAHWLKDGLSFTTLEKSIATPGGKDIVLYQARSGQRQILAPASYLIPPNEKNPLPIDGYSFSEDMKKVLIYTNSQRVWGSLKNSVRELNQLSFSLPSFLLTDKK